MGKRKEPILALLAMEGDFLRVQRLLEGIRTIGLTGLENEGIGRKNCEAIEEIATCCGESAARTIEAIELLRRTLSHSSAARSSRRCSPCASDG
jgi:hypothetical protein